MYKTKKECYSNYPFGDCDNCNDITVRQNCIQNSSGIYCGCKRKLKNIDYRISCSLCGAIVCRDCAIPDEDFNGDVYCKTCYERYPD